MLFSAECCCCRFGPSSVWILWLDLVVRQGSGGSVWSWCCGGELFVGVVVVAGGLGDAMAGGLGDAMVEYWQWSEWQWWPEVLVLMWWLCAWV
jgi:hypothetical protein